jgi:hypothetical protein
MQLNSVNDIGTTLATCSPFFDFIQAGGTSAVAEEAVGVLGPGPNQIPIGSITIHPSASLAISGSAFITVNVFKRTNGGSQTLIGTLTTFTGGTALTAFVAAQMTLQAGAGSFLTPGDTITMAVTNTGSAVMPAFVIGGFVRTF